MNSIDIDALVCPFCNAKNSLTPFASYSRHLVTYSDGTVFDNTITISRYVCSSCGHTHAILPSVIIPYISFSFQFNISLVYDYLVHTFPSLESLCVHYSIAISTFYRIFKRFKEHKALWLGLLDDSLKSDLAFTQNILNNAFIDLEHFILSFFLKTALSFLQENVIVRIT